MGQADRVDEGGNEGVGETEGDTVLVIEPLGLPVLLGDKVCEGVGLEVDEGVREAVEVTEVLEVGVRVAV